MLTHPPDSLPQIVFPMDEGAIPPHPYCSPPPHSEPPPPLLPLSSITPSCVNDGISGSRRSGRIQGIQPQTPTKPSRPIPSPPKRQRESKNMVQVSQKSKRPAVEGADSHEKSNKAGFAFIDAAECQNKEKDRRSPRKRSNPFVPEDAMGEFEAEQHPYGAKSQSDSGGGLADESATAPKGWVIGPLFQSFKSKMASFTEIVMSPVKLFRSNSPPPTPDCLHTLNGRRAEAAFDLDSSQQTDAFFREELESGKRDEEPSLRPVTLDASKPTAAHSRKLTFDVEPPVPSQHHHSSTLFAPPDHTSASQEPKVKMIEEEVEEEEEEERGRPAPAKPRQRTRTKKVPLVTPACGGGEGAESDPELSELLARVTPDNSADNTPTHTHSPHPGDTDKTELGNLAQQSSVNNGHNEGTLPERPPTPDTHSASGSGRSKRALKADCNAQTAVKRKKDSHTVDSKSAALVNEGATSRGLRPPRKDVTPKYAESDDEEPAKPVRKRKAASARVNKKARAEAAPHAKAASLSDGVASPGENGEVPESMGTGSGRKPGRPKAKRDPCTASAVAETTQPPEPPAGLQLQGTNTCVNTKPRKRKSPGQASAGAPPDLAAVSTSQTGPGSVKVGRSQTNKRPKKDGKASVKKSGSGRAKQSDSDPPAPTKPDSQSKTGGAKVSTEPVYFEMTPSESHQLAPPPSDPPSESLQRSEELHRVNGDQLGSSSAAPLTEQEVGNHGNLSKNGKPRRVDKQRRRCRVLHGGVITTPVSKDDASLATDASFGRRLSRSYSCPEIPALFSAPPAPVHAPPPQQQQHTSSSHAPGHAHWSPRRARRHTVCSVEVEREIAPLCLRKEVYPSRRSLPYDGFGQRLSPTLPLSPSTSLTALASCFLSSPLAFLSRRAERESSSSAASAASSSSWLLPRFLQRSDTSDATMGTGSSSENPLESRSERRTEEEDDGGDTSSSSQEFEDVALREEKALSDSEIKVVQKLEQRGKVSSIRIRKTLPKPQNNLTPMGLPKPIRLKKKEFSLEEIYTNKNFSKPPESRLETVFEVPLSRRNGSESWFGQRRVKRFLEFLEVGESRRPRKPLAGAGKTTSLSSSSRTRRAGFAKDEASAPVDVDSLLCAKLDQLSLWLIHDQTTS